MIIAHAVITVLEAHSSVLLFSTTTLTTFAISLYPNNIIYVTFSSDQVTLERNEKLHLLKNECLYHYYQWKVKHYLP